MPGILPMKVIKVGGVNNQMRIAQACDRCRSKKIRCDGLTPTCTQCKNVAFECKTSDKLSRRAFPRGYTESLEDRVRALELEVRELKDLLDEKDEKIDMLSRMHSQSPMGRRKASMTPPANNDEPRPLSIPSPREETFKILQPPFLSGEGEDAYFIGSSSGRALIDAFKRKLQESGKPVSVINTASFFPPYERSRSWLVTGHPCDVAVAPPRLLSDQLVNIFFQEWAPLFPILHRPTFLSQYEQYVSDTSNITDRRVLTQLNLVFGIAALSQTGQLRTSVEQYEKRWSAAMEGCYLETSLASLQCLILAQVHAMLSASPMKLLHFRSRAVGMSQRLGLHLSQKRFPLGALTTETRKRIFWTLYTLDCFAAATFGLPRLIMEADVECEYPVDADDEFVTEEGFMPVVPGSSTKLSSALALFRCSRVLAKVLEGNYPASASYELSLGATAALDAELEAWQETLAPHLRMEFVQDKPSTNIISSRSPLLALTYHYIRTLIHRPAAQALGSKASASVVALASSSKRIVQLVQLLDERNLNFSHCMNKDELLVVSGFGLLFQATDLEKDGKFMKDVSRMVYTVANMLDSRHAPGAAEFRAISGAILPNIQSSIQSPATGPGCTTSDIPVHTQKQLQALTGAPNGRQQLPQSPIAVRKQPLHTPDIKAARKLNTPAITVPENRRMSQPSLSQRRPSQAESLKTKAAIKQALQQISPAPLATNPNLDYLQFKHPSVARPAARHSISAPAPPTPGDTNGTTRWDGLIESFNGIGTNVSSQHIHQQQPLQPLQHHGLYDNSALYLGTYLHAPNTSSTLPPPSTWSPEVWAYNMEQMHMHSHLDQTLGFSDESLTSGSEDFSSIDASSIGSEHRVLPNGLMMPPSLQHDTFAPQQFNAVDLEVLNYW